jgi:hypothetical protein
MIVEGETGRRDLVIASDLDRTLIYSLAACRLGGLPVPEVGCVEYLDGKPLSYLTRVAAERLAELNQLAVFVPTTTRTVAQLGRVQVPGPAVRYAVAANGGHIVVDGVPDPEWSEAVTQNLAGLAAPMAEVWPELARVCDPAWTLKLRTADDLFCYAVIDRPQLPSGFVEEVTGWCAERGWTTSLQGRKLYFVPAPLTKSAAVLEVCRRVGAAGFAAAGDSLLDAELLAAAVTAIRPAHGELHDLDWSVDHLTVTTVAGVRAGEEIATWLLQVAQRNGIRAAARAVPVSTGPGGQDPVSYELPVTG